MKKLFLLLPLILGVTFASCGEDDEINDTKKEQTTDDNRKEESEENSQENQEENNQEQPDEKEEQEGNKEPSIQYFSIILSCEPVQGGEVTGSGFTSNDHPVQISATPKEGYVFVKWSDGDTSSSREITSNGEDVKLIAYFEKQTSISGATVSGSKNGYTYVDMGLSVMWATNNFGAKKPTEYGHLIAWGETAPKNIYSYDTYKFGDCFTVGYHSKYWTYTFDDFYDNLTILEPSDDAATTNWGSAWRTPTKEEFDELFDACTWTWTKDFANSGVAGIIGTSTINGNVIFLPAAGVSYYDTCVNDGKGGNYWTSTLGAFDPIYGTSRNFSQEEMRIYYRDRDAGCSIRPVTSIQ